MGDSSMSVTGSNGCWVGNVMGPTAIVDYTSSSIPPVSEYILPMSDYGSMSLCFKFDIGKHLPTIQIWGRMTDKADWVNIESDGAFNNDRCMWTCRNMNPAYRQVKLVLGRLPATDECPGTVKAWMVLWTTREGRHPSLDNLPTGELVEEFKSPAVCYVCGEKTPDPYRWAVCDHVLCRTCSSNAAHLYMLGKVKALDAPDYLRNEYQLWSTKQGKGTGACNDTRPQRKKPTNETKIIMGSDLRGPGRAS